MRLEDVSFTYPNGTRALDRLSLDIPAGTILGVVGPSGCGKSTLLHLLAGLSTPTSGRIIREAPEIPGRHFLSMVFQKDTLLPWLRVLDNVKLYFRFHKADRREVEERARRLLDLVGLSDAALLYPYQLSGGMRRRVAFLAGIAPFPQVLLLDEPFSALDEPTRVAVHQDVLDTLRRLNIAAVIVTHDLAEAASLCDEVAIFTSRPGRIASRYRIPFSGRREVFTLRKEPGFLELYGRLWDDLSRQIILAKGTSAAELGAARQ